MVRPVSTHSPNQLLASVFDGCVVICINKNETACCSCCQMEEALAVHEIS